MPLKGGARMKRKLRIGERLEKVEEHLRNAEAYVARGVNVESRSSFLHFRDWQGNSGHPLWMRNVAIPAMKRARERYEKRLDRIAAKAKDKRAGKRRASRRHAGPASCVYASLPAPHSGQLPGVARRS